MPKIPKRRGEEDSPGRRIRKHRGKKTVAARALVDRNKFYELNEALELFTKPELNFAKFDQTVEMSIRLGVDPRKADQNIRGALVLPHGLGKEVKVLVFAKGEKAQEAKDAGADFVGAEELVDKIQDENWLEFDKIIATPDMMRHVGKIGKILGPRKLMPSPKEGTITFEIENAVKEAKAGKISFRLDKVGIIHSPVGKASFGPEKLAENIQALVNQVLRMRPQTAKGTYFKKASLSMSQSPGLRLDVALLQK